MSDTRNCTRCGAPLPKADEPCPRCLLELGRSAAPAEVEGAAAGERPRPKRRPAPTPEELARRFPELEVAERLGEGGMGVVYKARQVRIDRLVALKVLMLDPGDDPTFAERFRREAVVLARLDHPNVVKLYDFGERDGLFYLLLELVDGPNLRTLMKQRLLAPRQALAIVPQICEALQFAHDEGVVHRDIKPENVLLDAKGRVKIADFGLAKLVDADTRDVSLTEIGQVMGTPHYMAPEQLRGSREVDHRADIYSLGVVFYEMLTGELPRGKFELPSQRVQVDVKLDGIVLKSLERTPERRYQHAVEVKTDVESVGSESSVATESERRAGQGQRVVRVAVHPSRPWEFFLTFLVLWPLAGLAFNGGPWWLAGAMALIAVTFWSQIEWSIRARPDLEAALAAEKRGKRAVRHLAAMALLAAGCFALFAGHIALFASLSPEYRGFPQGFRPDDPELLGKLSTTPGASLPWRSAGAWALDGERIWSSDFLLLLAPALLLGAALVLTSKKPLSTRRSSWISSATAVGTALGALAVVEGVAFLLAASNQVGGSLVPVLDRPVVASPAPHAYRGVADLSRRLRIALIRQGYVVLQESAWVAEDPRTEPAVEQELKVFLAEPASPFLRWRLSWTGPHRVQPSALFAIAGPSEDGPVHLGCSLGDVAPESPLRETGSLWLAVTLGLTDREK